MKPFDKFRKGELKAEEVYIHYIPSSATVAAMESIVHVSDIYSTLDEYDKVFSNTVIGVLPIYRRIFFNPNTKSVRVFAKTPFNGLGFYDENCLR